MKVTPCFTERELSELIANAPVREYLLSEDETLENYVSSEEEAPDSNGESDTSEPDEYVSEKKTVKNSYSESSNSSLECLGEVFYKNEKKTKAINFAADGRQKIGINIGATSANGTKTEISDQQHGREIHKFR